MFHKLFCCVMSSQGCDAACERHLLPDPNPGVCWGEGSCLSQAEHTETAAPGAAPSFLLCWSSIGFAPVLIQLIKSHFFLSHQHVSHKDLYVIAQPCCETLSRSN